MDRQQRNIAKERQIQMAEEWQAALDKVREDINTAREAYRQTFIAQVSKQQLFQLQLMVGNYIKSKGGKSFQTSRTCAGNSFLGCLPFTL